MLKESYGPLPVGYEKKDQQNKKQSLYKAHLLTHNVKDLTKRFDDNRAKEFHLLPHQTNNYNVRVNGLHKS